MLLHVSIYLWVIIVLESSAKILETMRNIPVCLAVPSDCYENSNSTTSIFLLSIPLIPPPSLTVITAAAS